MYRKRRKKHRNVLLHAISQWIQERILRHDVHRRRKRRRRIVVTSLSYRSLAVIKAIHAALILVLVICVFQLGSIALRSLKTKRQNDMLSVQRAQYSAAQQETAPPIRLPSETPSPEITACPTPAPTGSLNNKGSSQVVRNTKYHQVGGTPLPQMEALREENHDLIAWIEIPEVMDLPVVYRDNTYYLSRDFYKRKNDSGTIFLDENHPFREKTQNLLLHGHNMKDGSMFGHLARYVSDSTYIRNHPFINFSTLWREEQYVIFAVLNVSLDISSNRFMDYFSHDTFTSDLEFETYVRQLQLKSIYAIPIDVEPSDALLTLSTCLDDDRLIIVARRFRADETRGELRDVLHLAVRQRE